MRSWRVVWVLLLVCLGPLGLLSAGASATTVQIEHARTKTPGIQPLAVYKAPVSVNKINGLLQGVFADGGLVDHYQCSASVVSSPFGDLLATAAHCVINPVSGVLASEVTFMPAYHQGLRPLGSWKVVAATLPDEYMRSVRTSAGQGAADITLLNEAKDVAFLTVAGNIQRVTGAVNVAFDYDPAQTYTVYGYPGDYPYAGGRLLSFTQPLYNLDTAYQPAPLSLLSDFSEGASGGSWLVGNELYSVTAYNRHPLPGEGGPSLALGPYFDDSIYRLYEQAQWGGNERQLINSQVKIQDNYITASGCVRLKINTLSPGRLDIYGAKLVSKQVRARGYSNYDSRWVSVCLQPRWRQQLDGGVRVKTHVFLDFKPDGAFLLGYTHLSLLFKNRDT